jgi:hypothetical protein
MNKTTALALTLTLTLAAGIFVIAAGQNGNSRNTAVSPAVGFRHTVTSSNVCFCDDCDVTFLDNAAINDKPGAVFVIQSLNGSTFPTVRYDSDGSNCPPAGPGRWIIMDDNAVPGGEFNVIAMK